MQKEAVILADGAFPEHEIPLGILDNAEHIICCDGGAAGLVGYGLEPEAIVGDMDSLEKEFLKRYADRLYQDNDQETNDLTKAVRWCCDRNFSDVIIVGATGKREDHTIGNISLLAEYSRLLNVRMVTDTGTFIPCNNTCSIRSARGQQVSVFSIDPGTAITSKGLLYPLDKRRLLNWWEATLNEATGDVFELIFEKGPVLVFLSFF